MVDGLLISVPLAIRHCTRATTKVPSVQAPAGAAGEQRHPDACLLRPVGLTANAWFEVGKRTTEFVDSFAGISAFCYPISERRCVRAWRERRCFLARAF